MTAVYTHRGLRAAGVAALTCLACGPAGPSPELALPERPLEAPGGSAVAAAVRSLDLVDREERLYREVARGNVPDRLRRLRPVEMNVEAGGHAHRIVFWVTPDYVSVGSDEDPWLTPLSPQTAQRLADLLDATLPTPAMVDAIWRAADDRLSPQRLAPRDSIGSVRTVAYYERHNSLILGQRVLRRVPPDAFVAGHKKDVVLSSTLPANPGRVAVYGWHRPDGAPNQELSTVATDDWVYYHHGVRLVHRRIRIDGVEHDLAAVLRDPALAPLLADGGPIAEPRYPLARAAATEG